MITLWFYRTTMLSLILLLCYLGGYDQKQGLSQFSLLCTVEEPNLERFTGLFKMLIILWKMLEFEFFRHAFVSSYPELIFYVNRIGFHENSIAF